MVAYYPNCPHCGGRTEVANPEFQDARSADAPRLARTARGAGGIPRGRAAEENRTGDPTGTGGAPPGGQTGGSVTVLVVEDDRELAEGLRDVLRREGYRVVLAENGVQGRDAVYRERPDLVILDMMMPRLGGFPVLEHFRETAGAPPFVMITANGGSRHKEYAETLGVIGYLRKPFAVEALLEVVARGLGRADSTQGGV